MHLNIKKLRADAIVPSYSYEHDAGLDLCIVEDATLPAGGYAYLPTGIAIELPHGCVGLVWDKSSMAKRGLKGMGGVIDEGFRGEVMVCLANLTDEPQILTKGQKIAQLLVQKVERVTVQETDGLSETQRGVNGWGSSGSHA